MLINLEPVAETVFVECELELELFSALLCLQEGTNPSGGCLVVFY